MMLTNKKSSKKMPADSPVKTSKKGKIELSEEELNKVTGGTGTPTTIGSAIGGAGGGKAEEF
jgi:bacteriocin-like protein